MTMRGKRFKQSADKAPAQRPTAPPVYAHPAPGSMGHQMDEERRLMAVHDPAVPSACRLCGQTVAKDWQEVAGWKTCRACVELLLIGVPVEDHETHELCERIPTDNPAYFVGRWPSDTGQATPWAHVAPTLAEHGREALRAMRVRGTLRPNSTGRGCMACGVARSTSWTQAPWRWGNDRTAGALCAECAPWVLRSGAYSGYPWREHLLAACVGMRRPQMGVDFELRAFHESAADPVGTAEPWEYLGAVRKELRARIIRTYPQAVTLTERERRVLALQGQIAQLEARPEEVPLARLD
jgi:hypothetical protein